MLTYNLTHKIILISQTSQIHYLFIFILKSAFTSLLYNSRSVHILSSQQFNISSNMNTHRLFKHEKKIKLNSICNFSQELLQVYHCNLFQLSMNRGTDGKPIFPTQGDQVVACSIIEGDYVVPFLNVRFVIMSR